LLGYERAGGGERFHKQKRLFHHLSAMVKEAAVGLDRSLKFFSALFPQP